MAIDLYHLGLPIWGMKEWVGHLYRRGSKPGTFLGQFADVWNAVEGNSTFYSLPPSSTVEKWRDATPKAFSFCFKLPRSITHERRLENAEGETLEFVERMAPLGPRLGPHMIQLPPSFGPDRMDVLDRFLDFLPHGTRFAVELRHPGFYAPNEDAQHVDALLTEHGCERVLMDTRAMRAGDPTHPDVLAAENRKPNLNVEPVALGPRPIVRLITHPDRETNPPHLDRWARILADWIRQGRRPYLFVHCPNDFHSPWIAADLHARLRKLLPEVGALPPWPGDQAHEPEGPVQLSLL